MSKFQAAPGTRDLFAPETDRWRALVDLFANEARTAGFGQIVTPMFEDIGVFTRLGEASDVVSKELYEFEDKGGRRIALRPEFTASVCRAFVETRQLTPWKSFYVGPAFRYDKPQKGRYRQFEQVGAEVIGSHDPDLDVEVIALAARFYEALGLPVGEDDGVTLLLNTLGDKDDRPGYLAALRQHFDANLDVLSEQSAATLEVNPLRVLDSKRPQDAEVISSAPSIVDHISAEAAAAFERVQAGLTGLGIAFELAPRLVRGLDYYTRTTFEFTADGLDAAQNAVGGGGRYDGLVADLGGPDEPGVGFALGIDRTLLACDAAAVFPPPDPAAEVWVVATTEGIEALQLTDELRQAGFRTDRSFDQRSMKAQMKAANRSGAAVAVIAGPDEVAADSVSLRPLRGDGDQQLVARDEMIDKLKELLRS